MQNTPDEQYKLLKYQSENQEDLIGRFLWKLIDLQNSGNAQISALSEEEARGHENDEKFGQSSGLQREIIRVVLLEIKKAIENKKVDFSDVLAVLEDVASSNSALYDVFEKVSGEYPKMREQLARIAELTAKNKPEGVVFDNLIQANKGEFSALGNLIVNLTEAVKNKDFPEEIKISGPVEIAKPKWWKPLEFSWEPLKELVEKIKAHTFSVKVMNPPEKGTAIDIDKLAKKIGGEVEKAIKQIPRGGGMGNPFTFVEGGGIKIDTTGLASETKQDEIIAAVAPFTVPKSTALTLTSANTAYLLPSTEMVGRRTIQIFNTSDTDIYVGDEDVTTSNGAPVPAGGNYSCDIGSGLYAVCGTAGKIIRILELK